MLCMGGLTRLTPMQRSHMGPLSQAPPTHHQDPGGKGAAHAELTSLVTHARRAWTCSSHLLLSYWELATQFSSAAAARVHRGSEEVPDAAASGIMNAIKCPDA